MKKTLTANIGGTVFNIEEDAFDRLQRYLASIRAQFAGSPSTAEIMADIEARIAELFQQRLEERQVVDIADVEHVIGVMGQPEDFADGEESGAGSGPGTETGQRRHRRLYRATDDRWVGGVLGGIAAYFNFDPLILRLVYLVALFMGWGVVLYIILWIVVPPAHTAAEKLEMRGEPVNVDNIKRMFDEGAERVKSGAEQMAGEAKDLGRKYSPQVKKGASGFFDFLGEMIRLFIRFIGKFLGVLLLLFGAMAAMVLAVVIIGRYDLLFTSGTTVHSIGLREWTDMVFLSEGQANWAWLAAVVFILVPVIGLLYGGISLLFDVKGPRWMAWALGPVWIVSIIVLTVIGVRVANDLRVPEEMGSEHVLAQPSTGGLTLMRMDPRSDALSWQARYKHGRIEMNGDLDLDGDSVRWNDAQLDVQRSPDSLYHLVIFRSARGVNSTEARERASEITAEWVQSDTTLGLSSAYRSSRSGKLRMQQVRFLVLVPIGGSVYLDESLAGMPDDIKNVTNTWDREMLGRTWTMTAKGLEDLNAEPSKLESIEEGIEEELNEIKEEVKVKVDRVAATVWRGLPQRRSASVEEEPAAVATSHAGIFDLIGRVVRL